MSNKINKPMMTSESLVAKMRDEKGIRFKYVTEEKAEVYLTDINNYLRTAAYRQNYSKYTRGVNTGKYINLDFTYLQEMSTVDMHFRFLINRMCLDIEQALKVKLVKDLSNDANAYKGRYEHIIQGYDDCPIWVLCEVLTFGEFLRLYDFYYGNTAVVSGAILGLVRCLRNGSAHNNCLLANLSHGTSKPSREIKDYVKKMESITTSQRQKKLSCRPMLEFVALIYTYELVVTQK